MGNDDDGAPCFAAGALEQGQHLLAGLVVQRTGGLIAEQELGVLGQRPGNGDALLLAARKLGREVVEPLAQTHAFQRGGGVQRITADLAGQLHIFQCSQILHQIVELEHEANIIPAVGGELFFGKMAHILPVQPDMALIAGVHAAQNIQQSGLACTRGTHNDAKLALVYIKIQVIGRRNADTAGLIIFGNILKLHKMFHMLLLALKKLLFHPNYNIFCSRFAGAERWNLQKVNRSYQG